VWAFARGCMRTYLILKDKARRMREDAEIQGLIGELRQRDESYNGPRASDGYSKDHANMLKESTFDVITLAGRGRRYEELDQLVMELLMGVR
jgi:xylose isomerase